MCCKKSGLNALLLPRYDGPSEPASSLLASQLKNFEKLPDLPCGSLQYVWMEVVLGIFGALPTFVFALPRICLDVMLTHYFASLKLMIQLYL